MNLMYKICVVKPMLGEPLSTYVLFILFYMNVVLGLSITSPVLVLLHSRFD